MALTKLKEIKLGTSIQTGPVTTSVNGLTGDVTIAAGSNISIDKSGSTITLNSTASGGTGGTTYTYIRENTTAGLLYLGSNTQVTDIGEYACTINLGSYYACGNGAKITFNYSSYGTCGTNYGLVINTDGKAYYNGVELNSGSSSGTSGGGTSYDWITVANNNVQINPTGTLTLGNGTYSCGANSTTITFNGSSKSTGFYIDSDGNAYYNGVELGSSTSGGGSGTEYVNIEGANCAGYIYSYQTLHIGSNTCGKTGNEITFKGSNSTCGFWIASDGSAYYNGVSLGSSSGSGLTYFSDYYDSCGSYGYVFKNNSCGNMIFCSIGGSILFNNTNTGTGFWIDSSGNAYVNGYSLANIVTTVLCS